MNPIIEDKPESGIGYSRKTFLNNFLEICKKHKKESRAKAFALILYKFHDKTIRKLINDNDLFIHLDRLTGKDISVFYLNSENKTNVKDFNDIFLSSFEIEKKFENPVVVFFNIAGNEVDNVEVVELNSSKLILAYKELHTVFENYLESISDPKKRTKVFQFVRLFSKVGSISIEKIIEKLTEMGFDKIIS